jgi:NADH-quinone oxidoreductase subunit H
MSPAVAVILRVLAALGLLLMNGVVLILMLRKVLGHLHIRLGPTRVGPWGMLQTVADVVKLLSKEDFRPSAADTWLFRLAPVLVFVPSFMAYLPLAFSPTWRFTSLDTGLLFIMAVSSLVPIGVVMAGWASNSKWSLLGGLRAAGQQIAYEVPLLLSVLTPVMLAGSLDMRVLVEAQSGTWLFGLVPRWFAFGPQIVAFVLYAISAQAETSQTPFDMSEAESELITGFANEYSGMRFAFMFLAEFSNMFIVSAVGVTLFFGGWLVPWADRDPIALSLAPVVFMIKVYVGIFVMMWIRGTLPRIRVDQLLSFAWKRLIPISLAWVVVFAIALRVVKL